MPIYLDCLLVCDRNGQSVKLLRCAFLVHLAFDIKTFFEKRVINVRSRPGDGPDGPRPGDGPDGPNGPDGSDGPDARPDGPDGPDGPDARPDGANGPDGPDGPDGADGSTARLLFFDF